MIQTHRLADITCFQICDNVTAQVSPPHFVAPLYDRCCDSQSPCDLMLFLLRFCVSTMRPALPRAPDALFPTRRALLPSPPTLPLLYSRPTHGRTCGHGCERTTKGARLCVNARALTRSCANMSSGHVLHQRLQKCVVLILSRGLVFINAMVILILQGMDPFSSQDYLRLKAAYLCTSRAYPFCEDARKGRRLLRIIFSATITFFNLAKSNRIGSECTSRISHCSDRSALASPEPGDTCLYFASQKHALLKLRGLPRTRWRQSCTWRVVLLASHSASELVARSSITACGSLKFGDVY
mmetsp:Transcript_5615/g.12222  ORF Transcript_5615/g.12222 Transcript_5615/m.12222 type:complete len:297 (-) Transcript_5615:314-1204(-)